MGIDFSPSARRLGIISALSLVVFEAAYAATLAIGFLSLRSPRDPIGDPMFSILEVLILAIAPLMVALMAAVHAWAPPAAKALSLTAVVFAGLVAGITCGVHFLVLTLSRHPAFPADAMPWLISFRWPSVAYALDILAWDIFFALAVLFAAPVFGGSHLARSVRALMIASGALALAGLGGVAAGSMQLRNIGILGYAGVFPVAVALLAVLFHRTAPATPPGCCRPPSLM